MSTAAKKFRPNVAAIIRSQEGLILVCERGDFPGCWQFPQGGIAAGESAEEAILRELAEEVSLSPENIRLREKKGPYRYEFGAGITKKGCDGQEQTYFLIDLLGPESLIDVETDSPEFTAARWVRPEDFEIEWPPPMKREVYRRVFRDFFQVEL